MLRKKEASLHASSDEQDILHVLLWSALVSGCSRSIQLHFLRLASLTGAGPDSSSHQTDHSVPVSGDLFGGLSTAQPTQSNIAGNGDIFGGLSTAQPAQGIAAGNGDMFGGLSVGPSNQSAGTAPVAGQPKQAQAAAAPYDADLFGGSLNGSSGPMGIPQQVCMLPSCVCHKAACDKSPAI